MTSSLSFAAGRSAKPFQATAGTVGSGAALAGQSRTLLPDGTALLTGGINAKNVVQAAYLENSQKGNQVPTSGSLLHARAFHTATLLPNGTVLIFGGIDSSSAIVSHAEIFNPSSQIFVDTPATGLTPRTLHTATLLTDGRLLIAGGLDGQGQTVGRIELWDFRTGQVSTLPVQLNEPRSAQTATLLPDGTVLLWGGQDKNGIPLNDGEIIDPNGPSVRLVSRQAIALPQAPFLEASIPQSGQTDAATDQLISLRFSKPMAMASLNSETITLRSPAGDVAVNVVPAEGGMLAFISPKDYLETETTYTLTISGAKDLSDQTLSDTTIIFTTGDAARDGLIPVGGGSSNSGSSANSGGPASDQNNAPSSNARQLPMLAAANGVTALAGQILTLDGNPLPNVRVEVGSHFDVSDNTGRFLIQNIGSGHHIMIIDGTTANSKSASYGLFRVGADLKAGVTNSLHYTVWMTPLDTEHEITIPSPTTSDTVITNPNVPGLELHIPAGTVIHDARGRIVTRVGITGIPVNQPPFPLKTGVRYPVYFTIQPGGSTFETVHGKAFPKSVINRGKGITIHYKNYLNASPGSRFAFWSYDPEQKGWYIYGHGRVSADAREIAPESGTQLWTFDGAMVSLPDNAPYPAPKLGNPADGEPVDLQTGLFINRKSDLALDDVIPLVLTRAYRPGDSLSRAFGIGTSMSFDDFMIGDDNYTTEGYTYQDLVLEDGARIHFTRISPCLGPNGYCDFTNALYEATSTSGSFYGAGLQYVSYGPYSNNSPTSDYWQLTRKDGTTYIFADSDDSSNPRDAAIQLIVDRNGNTVTFTRDNNSNLTRVSSPNGRWIQFTYDAQNRITQAQDNIGRTVSYSYDSAGYLQSVTDANGGITRYVYDSNGDMTSVQDPRGITYIQSQYDTNGLVTQQTLVDGSTYKFSYAVDGDGNVTQATVTDPRGYVRQVDFNDDGYMSSDTRAKGSHEQQTVNYNRQPGTGLLLSMTDALNRTTDFSYDWLGNTTSITRLAGTSGAMTTSYGYDLRFSEVSSVTDPLGNTTSFSYDSHGNMLTATDPLGNTTAYSYNSEGEPVSITDSLGNETQFGYDSGSLVSIIDPLDRATSRYVDGADRVLSITDPLNEQTTFVYDSLNEVTSTTDPMGDQTSFTYDGNGNLTSVKDANNHTTTYIYDNMDRLSSRKDPLGNSESFQYDGNGNLTWAKDRKGQITTFQYDGLNRRTNAQFNDSSTITYTWDAGNRITAIVDSVSGSISRGYDGLDRLTSETTPQGSVSYTYDADGRRQTMSVSGQTQVSYSFDNASRLTGIAQGTANVSFGYDGAGRRTSLTLPNGITGTYSYDAASQLTGIVYQGTAKAPANLVYTYDLAGRRTSVSGSLATTQLPAAVSSATYNADNQLTQWGASQMTYDANGNTLSDGMNTYVWDARNRLVSANNSGATFAYDALGRRTDKDILSANTNFLYDGGNPVQELNGSTVTANLLTGGLDEYFTRTDASGTSNFLTDALGSTVELTDMSGNSQVQYSYGPFGSISINGTTNNTYTYTGRETDGLGLYYYRTRYYNPATGRFISEDPAGFAGSGTDFYQYAGDDPIDFIDPFGLDKKNSCGPQSPQLPNWFQSLTGILPNGFIYYGNYGGPGWTGAQLTPYENLSPKDQASLPAPIDAQDSCYQQHDMCYSRARVNNGTQSCNSPSSSQLQSSQNGKNWCDMELYACLSEVNSSRGSGSNLHSKAAQPIFSIKALLGW